MVERVQPRSKIILPQKTPSRKRKCVTPLSSDAYFPVSTKRHFKPLRLSPGYHTRWYMSRMKAAQVRRIAHQKPYKVTVFADLLKIKASAKDRGISASAARNGGGGRRGKVTKFSKASRKRLIETLAKTRNSGFKAFLTMTYDDNAYMRHFGNTARDFEAFRKRFQRAFPTFAAVWRKETKNRKSGMLKGSPIPHFHLIVFTNADVPEQWHDGLIKLFVAWGRDVWHEITGSTDDDHLRYGFHCTALKSRKQVYAYVSKYVGKDDDEAVSGGRKWGRIGKLDVTKSETFRLDENEYTQLRRLIKKWLKNRKSGYAKRFSRMNRGAGCSVYGLGDAQTDGAVLIVSYGAEQLITAARVHAADRRQRDRGWSD